MPHKECHVASHEQPTPTGIQTINKQSTTDGGPGGVGEAWNEGGGAGWGTAKKGWADRQRHAERMVLLGKHLPAAEAALIQASFGDGTPQTKLATLLNMDVRGVNRRLKRLERRLLSPGYGYVIVNMEHFDHDRARVARACVIEGLSIRAAAERTGLTLHEVRMHRTALLNAGEALVRVGRTPGAWRRTESRS